MQRWALIFVLACGQPPPPPPSAVINISPPSVCQDDNSATQIRIDAHGSLPHLSLVYSAPDPSEPPLRYAWSFSGSAYQLEDGGYEADALILTMKGDRPLHVGLRVTNAEGGITDALATISITVRNPDGSCPLPTE